MVKLSELKWVLFRNSVVIVLEMKELKNQDIVIFLP